MNRLSHEMIETHTAIDEAEQKKKKKEKMPRTERNKAYQLCRAFDHALLVSLGVGGVSAGYPMGRQPSMLLNLRGAFLGSWSWSGRSVGRSRACGFEPVALRSCQPALPLDLRAHLRKGTQKDTNGAYKRLQ